MHASRRGSLLFCVLLVFIFGALAVHGAAFTPGNLVVYRMNDGAAALAATGTAVFLDEYTTAGALVQSIAVPTTTVGAQRRLVCSGSATSEGFLTRSTDGQYVVFSGYDAALGTASITSSTSATVPRVIGRVAANGTLDTTTALTDAISGGNPRSAASTNGTDLWLSGTSGGGGVRYATFGATTSTSLAATPTNLRALGIFGGQLYVSASTTTFHLMTVGTGTPTTSGQTLTNLPGFPTTGSQYGFFFADLNAGVAGVDTLYVADDTANTINKYSLVGGNWTANGTIALTSVRGLTGTVSGSNVTLYVTARTTLRTLTDTSGYNASITGSLTTLATAAANTAIQGVAFVPQVVVANQPIVPTCASPLTTNSGTATSEGVSATDSDGTVTGATITGITPVDPGTITLTGFTPAGGVGGTANATLNVSAATPANTYSVTIQWTNNDGTPQTANCVVSVVVNAPPSVVFIHDVQGNGAATPIPGSTVTVEGIVVGDYQSSNQLSGFFLQEEDADADADPATSEGVFIFCNTCPTAVAEGQKVQVTGAVSEFNNMTEITASTAPSVLITNAGNNLALVTPSPIDLPIAGVVNDFYEAREGMKVTFVDTLTVSEYFEQGRFGQIILYEGGRPRQFTEANPPSVAGNAAQADNLSRREVILDDENNTQESYLTTSSPPGPADGLQFLFHPRANGGLSVGTQGTDFFRGGDLVNGLTGVLHWSFAGFGADTWRIRPTAANPATFTVANPRPVTPPAVGGAIHVVGMNLLNYFTTIDTTASNNTGPCGPGGTLDCRGADSVAELNRQRERASVVVCDLNADVYGFMELENTTASATITDLLGAINARCGGAHPYAFVNTGGTLGTDAIRVQQIYRVGIVSPVGAPLSDLDPVHNRPPTAQTFDVVDAANPAFGQRFTVVANHFKSKGCPGTGADADTGDGQGCFNGTRTAQATRLLTWINGTVLPAAGDPDVILLGDFNSYAKEDPVTTLIAGGYSDLETVFHGANAYSYLFDGQLGHLDYGFASASMLPQITGADAWHINADENPLFDYNDEVRDSPGESTFEEKPDGSALVPPRVVYQPTSPYRASDHDPVLLGIFAVADLSITKSDSPDPVIAGNNLTYTITVTNDGPDAATNASWSDNIVGTTFVSLSNVAGWSCTTPAFGSPGAINCTNPNFGVGNAVFTLIVAVDPSTVTPLSNTATVTSATLEGNPGQETAVEPTAVSTSADLSVTKSDSPDPVNAGSNITYTITVKNAGPSFASTVQLTDTMPANTTFVSLADPGWSCSTPAVGGTGTITCSTASLGLGDAVFTLVVKVDPTTASGASISNSATVTSATSDPNPGDETGNSETTVGTSADLSVTKTDTPDPVNAGNQITYTITVKNDGPSFASTVQLTDTIPANTTFVSLADPGWSCSTPAVGGTGTITCSTASLGLGDAVFTLVVKVDPSVASGASISNSATVTSTTSDPNPGNETGNSETTVGTSADLSVTKTDTPDPVNAGANVTYTITVNNAGPSEASTVTLTDILPAELLFVSLGSPAGWSCSTPGAFTNGTVTCSAATVGLGDHVFTLVANVLAATPSGTVVNNSATVATNATADPNSGNETGSAATTVATSADMSATKTDSPDPVNAGSNITYSISIVNSGPSNADSVAFSDTLPTDTTFVSFTNPLGWTCSTPAVGAIGTVSCTKDNSQVAGTSTPFTLVVKVDPAVAAGTVIPNSVTVTSTTPDPSGLNATGNASTTVATSANLSVAKTDSADPVTAGDNLTYTITVNNAGPSNAATVSLTDTLPANTTFVSLSNPGWSCTTPAVGAPGTITCTIATLPVGDAVFTLVVAVDPAAAPGSTLSNTATVTSATTDPTPGNESDTEVTNVVGEADITVAKVDSPDPVTAGNNLTYTITVNNGGPSTAATTTFSDTLPANTTFVSLASPGGWSCTSPAAGSPGTVSCSNASFAAGNAVFTLIVAVDPSTAAGTIISNTATASSPTDSNTLNDSDTETTTVATSADLSVAKIDTPDPVTAGTNVTYTITINNAGPSTALTPSLADTVPANTTFVSLAAPAGWSCITPAVGGTGAISCSAASLLPGDAVFTLVVAVGAGVADGTIITNTATAASPTDSNSANDSGTATTTVGTGSADLSVTKTDSPDPVTPGNNLTYTITVNNAGPSNATSASLSESVPANTTFVSLASPAGWSCTTPAAGGTGAISCSTPTMLMGDAVFTLVVKTDPSNTAATGISNTATVTSATTDPNPGNESDTETTESAAPSTDLSVTKTDSPDPVNAGANITYTITVNNAGPSTATTVALTDNVPANTTFVSFTPAAGWSCTTPAAGGTGAISCTVATMAAGNAVFTLVVHVDQPVAPATVISNTATVTSATTDPTPGNNSDTEGTSVVGGSADLSVTKTDSPDPVVPGTNLSYTITVGNAGPSDALSVSLTDSVPTNTTFVSLSSPGGWSCTTPAAGGTGTVTCTRTNFGIGNAIFTLVVKVDASVASGTIITNTANVASGTIDPNPANGSATATTTAGTASANLSVTKIDTPDPVTAGTNLTYTITVNNAGPSNAATVSLTDSVPANTTFVSMTPAGGWSCTAPAVGATGLVTCTNASVALGNAVFTFVVHVDPAVASGTIITNTATVTSATADPAPGNESGTATTTVGTSSADLSITKDDSPDAVTAGSTQNYFITVTNNGPGLATSVSMTENVPADTTFLSITTPAGWTCTTPAVGGTGTVTCTTPSMAMGDADFLLTVTVDPAAIPGTVIIKNTATVTSATTDPNPGNESASTNTPVVSRSNDVSVTKTDSPDPVTPGTILTWTITFTNAGPSYATLAGFGDQLPVETTIQTLTGPAGWTCFLTGTAPGCQSSEVPIGSAVFTLTALVDPAVAPGTNLLNGVTAFTTDFPGDPLNDSSFTNTLVGPASADLSVAKVDMPDPVAPGSNLTYTITVNNAGPSNAATVSLADTLPAGTTFVSLAPAAGWSCTTPAVGAPGVVTCTRASFGLGNAVFTLVVHVDASVAPGTIITNTATATAASADPNTGNDSGTATTTAGTGTADLSVTKTDSPDPVTPGANLTYTITVNNAGPSNATSATLTDTVPANTTFVSFTAAGGWSCTTPAVGGTGAISCSNPSMAIGNAVFTLTVNVDPAAAGGTTLTNTATAASATTDPNPGNESGISTTTVGAPSAALSVTKVDTPDPVSAGSNITYTITVTNAGPSDALTAALSDTLPAGTTFVSLASAAGWSCITPLVGTAGQVLCTNNSMTVGSGVFTLTVAVDASVAGGTVITNTATATSAAADSNPADNSGTATTTVSAFSTDLSVTKTDAPDPVAPGTNVTYTITVNNAGPDTATALSLSDSVPANTTFVSLASPAGWSCTTPAVGGTGAIACTNPSMTVGNGVFTLIVNVNASTAGGTILTNTATVTSATAESNPGDESATATTLVSTSNADLSVTKTGDADPVMVGTNLTYTITVNNAGPDAATNATLNDTLPAETTFVSIATPAGWTCTTPAVGATGLVTCSNATMAVGSGVFTLVVNVVSTTPAGSVISNTATVVSATFDPVAGNESATETTTAMSPATVSGTKAASGPFTPGSTVTYTIVLSNAGPAAQSNNPGNEFTDVLPSQLTLISANATSGTALATIGTNTVTWNGSIAAGASVTITIQALIKANVTAGTTVSNQGSISFDADGNGTNEASAFTGGSPTTFNVAAAAAAASDIPALDGFGLAILAALLAGLGLLLMRRT